MSLRRLANSRSSPPDDLVVHPGTPSRLSTPDPHEHSELDLDALHRLQTQTEHQDHLAHEAQVHADAQLQRAFWIALIGLLTFLLGLWLVTIGSRTGSDCIPPTNPSGPPPLPPACPSFEELCPQGSLGAWQIEIGNHHYHYARGGNG